MKIVQIRSSVWSVFPVCSPNTGKYGPEISPYLYTYHAEPKERFTINFCTLCIILKTIHKRNNLKTTSTSLYIKFIKFSAIKIIYVSWQCCFEWRWQWHKQKIYLLHFYLNKNIPKLQTQWHWMDEIDFETILTPC